LRAAYYRAVSRRRQQLGARGSRAATARRWPSKTKSSKGELTIANGTIRISTAVAAPPGRGLALAAVLVASVALSACGSSTSAAPGQPPPNLGLVQDRAVPDVALLDENGQATSLAAYHGKVVVLANFLTLCQEECPLVTGAFNAMQRAVDQAGLGGKVRFVEVTVDPGRDTPARLAAYRQQFGVTWPLLTGSSQNLDRLWAFFGIFHQIVPEGQPPGIDWWTHSPLTYDVNHTDGFILLDASGHERFITTNSPNLHGHLQHDLRALLSTDGIQGLEHPSSPNWTVNDALEALSWLLGRQITPAG
jgi:protein SCO1